MTIKNFEFPAELQANHFCALVCDGETEELTCGTKDQSSSVVVLVTKAMHGRMEAAVCNDAMVDYNRAKIFKCKTAFADVLAETRAKSVGLSLTDCSFYTVVVVHERGASRHISS